MKCMGGMKRDGLNGTERSKGFVYLWTVFFAILIIAAILAGCGANEEHSKTMNEAAQSLAMPAESNSFGSGESLLAMDMDGGNAEGHQAATPPITPTASISRTGFGANEIEIFQRKLIYKANVALEVDNYGDAQSEVLNLVTLSGGYMLNFNDTQSRYELGGIFVIKVPSTGFYSFVNNLEDLKKENSIIQRSIQGQDVTEEYIDIESRLKAKQVVEGRLLEFMENATDTNHLLQFSNELARVQEEIEAMKGRMRFIDQNVAFSTVELRMYEKLTDASMLGKEKDNLFKRAGLAMQESGRAILSAIEGLFVVIAGALPILLVLVLLAYPIWLLYRKTRYRRNRKFRNEFEHSAKEQGAETEFSQERSLKPEDSQSSTKSDS